MGEVIVWYCDKEVVSRIEGCDGKDQMYKIWDGTGGEMQEERYCEGGKAG